MQFNHYSVGGAHLAADLVNLERDAPVDQVRAALHRYRVIDVEVDANVERVDLLRWARVLSLCFGGPDSDRQCEQVNNLLMVSTAAPYISIHDGEPHLHYRPIKDSLVSRVKAITSAGLAHMICFGGGRRLGRCLHPSCDQVYVDTSRNGRRAYCSSRCGSAAAVARYRAST